MSRYFFHVRDGSNLLPDEEGEELSSLDAARDLARESAREILSEAALSGRATDLNQQIEVTDEAGQTVLTLGVGHVVGQGEL